jgi:hypothetical protein
MKINELVLTESQIEELNLHGLGQGLGKAVGAVGGGITQGAKNVWSGMKKGFQAGQNALKPEDEPEQAPTQQGQQAPAPNATAQGQQAAANAEQTPAASAVTVRQINKQIPRLRTRDLQSVKKTVDNTIASKQKQPAQGQQAPAPAQAPEDDNPNIVRGYNENKVIKFESKFLGMSI